MKKTADRTSNREVSDKFPVAKGCFLTLVVMLVVLSGARSQDTFVTFNLGPWIGTTAYNVKATGQKGHYPIRFAGLDMMAMTDDLYMRINMNMISGTLAGTNFTRDSKDELFTVGSDVSFFEIAYGMNEGPFKMAFHFDYGMHGPRIPQVTEMLIYPEQNTSHYMSLGLEAVLYVPIGNIGRVTTLATLDPLLFSSSGKKILDGVIMGIESQIQFSAFRFIGVGITPRLEYRNYDQQMFRNDELGTNTFRVNTFTSSAQFHVFVGF